MSFRLDQLASTPRPDALQALILDTALGRERRRVDSFGPRSTPNYVWSHGGRIMTLDAPDEPLVAQVAEHHEVHNVEALKPLVAKVKAFTGGMNPHGTGGYFELEAELSALRNETGIDLDIDAACLREAVSSAHRSAEWYSSRDEGKVKARVDEEADGRIRRWLGDLLGRDFEVSPTDAPVIFLLQAVSEAPLVHLRLTERGGDAIANVGAGRLLRVRVSTFASEQPSPVRCTGCVADGNDVRVALEEMFDENLEGTVLRSVRRRREEEARRRADDDDGW